MELKIGSLFAGIGGIELGFRQAGFNIAWAIENDSACCKTYRHNFPYVNLIEADIRKMNPKTLCAIDVLTAGFPCQPFSVAGKQLGFQDRRGSLFFEIMRFADILKPEIIFLENVSNIMEHDNEHTLNIIHNFLAERNYYIRYKAMRASEYGNTPQIRDRLYMIAFRDLKLCSSFKYPEPIKRSRDIFSVLKQNEKKHPVYYLKKGEAFYTKAASVVTDKSCIYRIYHESIRPTRNQMCPTLTASMGTLSNQVPLVLDDYGIRKLTVRECLDFQGFPSDFYFPNTITVKDAYKQIGNSVCVPVVKRIAKQIRNLYSGTIE